MNPVDVGLGALALTVFLLLIRTPIAAALGVSATIGTFIVFAWRPGAEFSFSAAVRPTMSLLANAPFSFITNFSLATVPLFILMGHLAHEAGFTKNIYEAARLWLARLRGGVAMASVVGCGGFSAITGSSVACAAAMGRIAVPEMLKFGYAPTLATGAVAIGGTLGSLIPPSVLFILYGVFAEQSIGRLFIAAVIPGLISLLAYLVVIYIWATLRKNDAPTPNERFSWAEKFAAIKDCWGIVFIFIAIIGGIYGGLFTPTEAAGIGASLTLLLGVATKRLNLSAIAAALKESVFQSSMIFLIAVGGKLYVSFIALTGMSANFVDWLNHSGYSLALVMLLIILLYLVLGMFLDSIGIILLTLPIVLPVVEAYNLSLIWFGVVVIKLLEIGLVTPPIGLNVFVIKSIAPKSVQLETIFRGISFFLIAEVFVLGAIVLFPQLSLWLPSAM
ncbi:MAG: TRAP transporter large permease [Burkholderiaceae bacterium]